ncbi:hypothetical protein AMIS_74090 [Actinoplanes missouriensis 431]|uniref:PIN domain-containing protein n=1 Tax=Actinoplanes missouriensis (strain ATCC 14538 / DSM 43046 / CBS 188.64 / JCM 3121 / NBRC 102363 / NCIMB 12654 / NRRL B-3342 / UNCC 431) TaxID=512565 RepID=I0HHZ2_ACTM4|nr:hypothetical protein [Actinoplanes missouriensis]BAL92629.1 hypothetical protein AMIS_74090 [Actinoplanes missouriensis 431]
MATRATRPRLHPVAGAPDKSAEDWSDFARSLARAAIDAAVAEAALRQHRPVVMLTSDIEDMSKLCGDRIRLVAV